eukprot:2165674-Rhodomonas_salina.1
MFQGKERKVSPLPNLVLAVRISKTLPPPTTTKRLILVAFYMRGSFFTFSLPSHLHVTSHLRGTRIATTGIARNRPFGS